MLARALSILLAIPLTPERPIAPPQSGPVTPFSFTSAIASNGESYLTSWYTDTTTHLQKVDDAGHVLLEREMPEDLESVVALGHDYLGVTTDWHDRHVVAIDGTTFAARQSSTRLAVAGSAPAIASNGTTALIAMYGGSAQLVDANGDLVGAPITFGTAYHAVAAGAIPNGPYFVVSATDDNSIALATIIQADGTLVRAQIPLKTPDAFYPSIAHGAVASDGTNVLVTWRNGPNVYVAVLAANGTIVRGPAPIPGGDWGEPPRVAWNGRQYVVTFDRASFSATTADVVTQHVDANGHLAGAIEVVASGHEQTRPVIASTGRSTLVSWRRVNVCSAIGGGNESARLVEPAAGAPFVLSQGDFEQQHPSLSAIPGTALAVWTEVADVRHLRMATLPQGDAVDLPGTRDGQDWAVVGSDGSSFLVAFIDLPDVTTNCVGGLSVATVDASGRVGRVTRIADDAAAARPAIAWNGEEYAVIWQTRQVTQLVGMRVARDGTPLDTAPHPISAIFTGDQFTTYTTQHASIAWTGHHYLVSWNFTKSSYIPLYPDPPPLLDRRTRLLSRDLTPEAGEVQFTTPHAFGAAMAWNGSEALLLWRNSDDVGLWGTRLTADGYLLGERRIDDLAYVTGPPSLTWNGHEWLAAFGTRLFRIAPDLTLLGSEYFGSEVGVTTIAAVGEATTVVYDRQGGELPAPRVFVRGSVPARRRIAP